MYTKGNPPSLGGFVVRSNPNHHMAENTPEIQSAIHRAEGGIGIGAVGYAEGGIGIGAVGYVAALATQAEAINRETAANFVKLFITELIETLSWRRQGASNIAKSDYPKRCSLATRKVIFVEIFYLSNHSYATLVTLQAITLPDFCALFAFNQPITRNPVPTSALTGPPGRDPFIARHPSK